MQTCYEPRSRELPSAIKTLSVDDLCKQVLCGGLYQNRS